MIKGVDPLLGLVARGIGLSLAQNTGPLVGQSLGIYKPLSHKDGPVLGVSGLRTGVGTNRPWRT